MTTTKKLKPFKAISPTPMPRLVHGDMVWTHCPVKLGSNPDKFTFDAKHVVHTPGKADLKEYNAAEDEAKMEKWHKAKEAVHDAHPDHEISDDEFKHHEKVQKGLKAHHKKSVKHYKRGGDGPVNTHLRETEGKPHPDHEQAQHIKHLDHVTGHKLEHDKTVYRACSHSLDHHKLQVGHTIKDHAYTSTSHDHGTALAFAKAKVHKDEHGKEHHHITVAKIHLPKGTRAHHVDTGSTGLGHDNGHENEVLVHRGTTYKVTGKTHHDMGVSPYNGKHYHRHVIHMTVHHQEDHSGHE